jgi:hypothetical protein
MFGYAVRRLLMMPTEDLDAVDVLLDRVAASRE